MLPLFTLAAALSLAPAQGAELKFTNLRASYGFHGPTRTDMKFLPGDQLYLGFDINGVKINKEGTATYTMAMDVVDSAGKSWQKVEPTDRTDFVPLGGTVLPGRAFVVLGVDMPPGEYTLKLATTDKNSGAKGEFTRKFEVLKPDLGVVGVYASVDPEGRNPAHTTGFVGSAVWLQFAVTGFKRNDANKNQPDVKVEMTILDETGKPTLETPRVETVTALEEKYPMFALKMNVPMTRVGTFKAKFTVTDRVSMKVATFELPMTVLPADR